MNRGIIRYVLGRMLLVEAVLLIFPLIVGLIYSEGIRTLGSFMIVIGALAALGLVFGSKKPANTHFYTKEGLVIASLTWTVLSLFGCLPFIISGEIPSFVDAFFETASGITTTGSSILTDVEAMSRSLLFWRSFTHLVGGMGVLVLALAVLPAIASGSSLIMKAEVPGPTFGKLVAKIRDTARILYLIYLSMTAVLIVLLIAGGMDWFDACIHAFGAAGTGGFSNKATSLMYYDNTYFDVVLGFAMLAFGVNFNLYYYILIRQVKRALKNEELHWYLAIILAAIALISINIFKSYDSFSRTLRDAFFSVSSIITTTGYANADFAAWPALSQIVLLLLMFFGACAGSTGGGFKISRIIVLVKTAIAETKKSKEPRQVVRVKFEGRALQDGEMRAISRYFAVYVSVFVIIVLLVSFESPDVQTAISATIATYNNIGPGLGMVGPMSSFAAYSPFIKLVLSFGMIAGRLELYPVLVLFLPSTWHRRG
ncbi:MAG: TrkH family potassium uptake protein [Clostridiales bacterium]|nr:TrkH family potassium uptake protein [Clostridiales bacterium]